MEFIYNFLAKKLAKKKHEVLRLQWQKIELERQLQRLKEQANDR